MNREVRPFATVAAGLALVAVVSGCGPSTEQAIAPPAGQLQALSQGAAASNGWAPVQNGVLLGEKLQKYIVNSAATIVNGRAKSSFTLYGQVNVPDTTLLAVSLNGQSDLYYQQGKAAYQAVNGKWMPSTPVGQVDVYRPYQKLVSAAMNQGITLKQFPRQYVIDEYCTVYEAEIPSSLLASSGVSTGLVGGATSSATSAVTAQSGDILMAFYVGQRTGVLREVAFTGATSGAHQNLTVTSNTEISNLNKPNANVIIPPTLLKQVSGLP